MKPIRRSTSTLLALPLLAAVGLVAPDAGAQGPASGDSYEVTIGSGPFAGTHRGTGELNCMVQDGSWGADFSEERDRGLSMLNLVIEGVPESGGSSTDVHLGLVFGRLGDPGGSSGGVGIGGVGVGGAARATAERDGPGAVMRVEGTTSYGAKVSAVIRCRSVE